MASETRGEARRRGRSLGLAVCLVAVSSLWAGAAAALNMTEAVQQALANNHGVAAKQHAQEAAEWAHRQARSQLLPSLSLESSYTRLDDDTVDRANAFGREFTMFVPDGQGGFETVTVEIPQTVFRDGYETRLTAQMLLFHPQVWNGKARAASARDLAGWQTTLALQETAHQTLRACLEVLKTRSLLDIQQQHLQQARDNTDLARRLFDVGRYSEADILQWQVEEVRQQGTMTLQGNARSIAAMNLQNLLGAAPTGRVDLTDDLPAGLVAQIEYFQNLAPEAWQAFLTFPLEQLVAANPTLQILAQSEDLVGLEHQSSKYNYLPSVSVGGSYGWQHNDTMALDGDRTWSANVTLSLPLFTSFGNYAQLKTTGFKLKQAHHENEEARRGLYLAGETARTSIRSYCELLRLAETSLSASRRNLEIMRNNYTLGRLTNLEWIQANLNVQQAEQVVASAYFDLALAIVDYYQARGEIASLIKH